VATWQRGGVADPKVSSCLSTGDHFQKYHFLHENPFLVDAMDNKLSKVFGSRDDGYVAIDFSKIGDLGPNGGKVSTP